MQSGMISKIQKAHQYAEEPDRLMLVEFRTTFRGDHGEYEVEYRGGHWKCGCNFFQAHFDCSHVMAIQRILHDRLPKEAHYSEVVPAAV
jgi:hypothetical protein